MVRGATRKKTSTSGRSEKRVGDNNDLLEPENTLDGDHVTVFPSWRMSQTPLE